eukprot:CAMPEP_0202018232 /NCGR_PEP_ID=MMETSP0905-20130828/38984_1 /ASSEMBLY_ACC=CAM_ASM_000554 /TAXON_ID=420261 /ORGANISM="Thalassiosira antarctica, Strain CCMP982" /LENGTH=391 /DNA_ID=CAMNT_0048579117 /DNA_START=139 /DNA_END=1311 /DNA_ORIENTATION=+
MAKMVSDDSPTSSLIGEEHQDNDEPTRIEDKEDKEEEPSMAPNCPIRDKPTCKKVGWQAAGDNHITTDDRNQVAALIDEASVLAPVQEDNESEGNGEHKAQAQDKSFELADIVPMWDISEGLMAAATPAKAALDRVTSRRVDPLRYSTIIQTAKLANEAKNDRLVRRLQKSTSTKNKNKMPTANLSIDEDVAYVDKVLIRASYAVILCWLFLILLSYWIVPPGSIQRYEGTERNAALVELSILSTAVIMKHFPLLWEMNFMDMTISSLSSFEKGEGRNKAMMVGRTHISGILAGGLVTQFIAIMSVVIMVCFPVPVMIDPILGSRVHFIRYCEWIPLAGYMSLMTECIDAPAYDGENLIHPWKTKFFVAGMQSVSTFCGILFPFCTNLHVW